MGDKRFDDRLKRIAKRTNGGAQVELIAGVGDMNEAKQVAEQATRQSLSLILVALGAAVGIYCVRVVTQRVPLQDVVNVPREELPTQLMALAQSDMLVGAIGVMGCVVAFLTLTSLLRGRKAATVLSFSGAAFGAMLGGLYAAL